MDEEKKAVTEATQEPVAEEVATPQPEAKVEESTDSTESSSVESSTTEEGKEEIKNSAEDKKPTRRDRRIHKLIDKLKSKDQEQMSEEQYAQTLGIDPNAPLIKEEEAQMGIDPNVLNQRQRARELLVERRAKNAAVAEIEYKASVKDHLADAEDTLKKLEGDDVLDEIVASQYDALNYQTDPYTGQKYFVPKVKMSEIYAKQQKVLEAKIAKAQADVSVKLAQQSQDSVVRPSATGESGRDHDLEASFNEAKDSESIEKWAAHLKKLGI